MGGSGSQGNSQGNNNNSEALHIVMFSVAEGEGKWSAEKKLTRKTHEKKKKEHVPVCDESAKVSCTTGDFCGGKILRKCGQTMNHQNSEVAD